MGMSKGVEEKVFYFEKKGAVNTDRTLDIALACCKERKMRKIVVASSSGKTALACHEKAKGAVQVIGVTYSAGSRFREEVEEFEKNKATMTKKGIWIVRGLHALSGVERTFENKYKSGFTPLNIVADTLRMFSHGMKVCVEVAVMAAEAGYVTPDEEIVVTGGTGHGADTAVIMKPAYGASMFDIKIKAVLCMPG